MTRTCDCCKESAAVNDAGLCFACDVFQSFTSIIREETDLAEDEALDLAGELQEHILSTILDRLQLPGQAQLLVAELLKTMERVEPAH